MAAPVLVAMFNGGGVGQYQGGIEMQMQQSNQVDSGEGE
jgi:hypothetical protein